MTDTQMQPKILTKNQFLGLLNFIHDAVKLDDSLEGSLEYHAYKTNDFEVQATIRFGNKEGQGFMRMIGEFSEE